MSFLNRHFLDFSHLNKQDIHFFFNQVHKNAKVSESKKVIGLLFLENSTRTITSFELACHDLGYIPLRFDPETSSLKKGETILDTLFTMKSMGVSAFVIRHGSDFSLKSLSKDISVPIINAGEGTSGHPTQALLDAYTILQIRGKIEGERLLIVGDSRFSRVAQSNLELMQILGAEVAFCGPEDYILESGQQVFENLEQGLKWASVVMALRPQLERHEGHSFESIKSDFIQKYSITTKRLQNWKLDGIILHPGPFIRDQEIESSILNDSRCKIWKQVENGRYIRKALLGLTLGDL